VALARHARRTRRTSAARGAFLLQRSASESDRGRVGGDRDVRAFAVTAGRSPSANAGAVLAGPARIAETARIGLALYREAGVLVLHSRHPRTGGVVLDLADLSDEALEILRAFAGERR